MTQLTPEQIQEVILRTGQAIGPGGQPINHTMADHPTASGGGAENGPNLPNRIDPFTGFTPKYAMEGFNFSRLQQPNKSAKDAFAYFAQQAPPPPLEDKNALAVWFNTYIKPGMAKLGHNVTDVQGDKFRYNNHEGDFWVDFGRGAGASGGALAWQADYANGGPANQSYSQTQKTILGAPVAGVPRQAISGNLSGVPQYGDLSSYYQYLQGLMQGK